MSFVISPAFSQNAPITTCATINNAVPGAVSVPITVTGFTNIGAISLTIDYEYAVMHFVNGVPNSQLMPFPANDADLGNGKHRITMGWFGSGKTLPDGSTIMTLNFSFIAGSTALQWFDNGSSCEYADGNYNTLNDLPTSTYYINGYVCGVLAAPGTITGNSSVCLGQTGYNYSVAPVPGAIGYVWTVPPGAVIAGGGTSTWVIVDYPAGSSSGNVTVAATSYCGTGPVSQLPVTVNALPVADAGNDTTIPYGTSTTLHAANGGSGSYSYHWYPEFLLVDPNVQDPVTVQLVSTNVFTVLVTDLSTYCQNSDQVIVAVSGGPLNVNPVAEPDSICRGSSSQLYANAGGGSGNYTYQWTCSPPGSPPWSSDIPDPVVTPDTTTQYTLTVYDGFTTVMGWTTVTVTPVPGAPFIELSGTQLSSDTCCGNQWYLDGLPIAGATGQYYEVTGSGAYFDIVTVNGCSSDTSNFINVFPVVINEAVSVPELLLFPNPARDVLNVRIPALQNNDVYFAVYDLCGRRQTVISNTASSGENSFSLDISRLDRGAYILSAECGEAGAVRKVFIVF